MIQGDQYPDISDWPDLPSHVAAESAILGHVLLDNKVYAQCKLDADEFSLASHKLLWLRMGEMLASGRPVDDLTLANYLAGKTRSAGLDEENQPKVFREIDDVGGVAYLAGLTEGLIRREAVSEYVAIVKEKAMLRRVIAVCEDAASRARAQGETAAEIVAAMGVGLKGISKKR